MLGRAGAFAVKYLEKISLYILRRFYTERQREKRKKGVRERRECARVWSIQITDLMCVRCVFLWMGTSNNTYCIVVQIIRSHSKKLLYAAKRTQHST